jgi:hypothetical protein
MPRAKLNDISIYYEAHGEGHPQREVLSIKKLWAFTPK